MERFALVSFVLAVSGLGALAAIAFSFPSPVELTGALTADRVGQIVTVCGTVEGVKISKNNHTFFSVADEEGSIRVVAFNSSQLAPPTGPTCVTGRLNLYRGDLEIIADRLTDHD
ncbi:MAG: OB-fold nucleic acid binding domain-containing protein [Candidatus Aenigmarchaeota archaeon]|nr:OB-fold nucleic acid binding domain-containing protein [Candidatus Aenigmarchaeota archaeon]